MKNNETLFREARRKLFERGATGLSVFVMDSSDREQCMVEMTKHISLMSREGTRSLTNINS